MLRLKERIPLDWKLTLNSYLSTSYRDWDEYKMHDKQRIFVFLAGFYQNLGDMAITLAQRDFLKRYNPDSEIVLVPDSETYFAVKAIKKYIHKEDLVTIIGGGNMSDMYIHHETARRHVIKSFPNNRIVSFPQTMFFSENKIGRIELHKSQKIYCKHDNLVLFAREPLSYSRMKQAFPDLRVENVPDIVLSLNRPAKRVREGIVCCLRRDKEQAISQSARDYIVDKLKENYSKVEFADTVDVKKEECTESSYEETLNRYWDKLHSAECVVTDRLHGMIFSAITGTPCVAIDNANHKVKSVYDAWLSECSYIKMLSDYKNVLRETESLKSTFSSPQTIGLERYFDELKKACIGGK